MYLPKWYKYNKTKFPFVVRAAFPTDVVVLVEDAASACAVSEVYDSIALLGTNFLSSYLPYVKNYAKVYVCLDKDATDKAIDMAMMLGNFVNAKLVPLEKDLKNYNSQEIKDFFNGLEV